MKKVFITGGAGFIGSHLVDLLMARRYQVTVYDNLYSGKIKFIKHHFKSPGFKFIKADLLNLNLLKKSIKGHDIVFHLAANPDARMGNKDTSLDLRLETVATYNTLEAMRVNEIKKIVFASSGTIYGETPIRPIPEDYGPSFPISLYGAGKLAGEGLISAFVGTFDFQAWIYRFGNVVGGRATHGVMFDFVNKLKKNPKELLILGDGTQEKPYIFVEDCVRGILFGLGKASEKLNVYNLGTPDSVNVNTIAKLTVQAMGLDKVRIKHTAGKRGWPGDVAQYRCDTRKMKKLGWQARYNSLEAVKNSIVLIVRELAPHSCR